MLSEQEKENFLRELTAYFLKNYPLKKSDIENNLKIRMREKLLALFHELKGNGGSIGHMFITQKCAEIERTLKELPVDWEFVERAWKEVDDYIMNLNKSFSITI
jgi:HPt (histidine-containing phosphotransfer) domain-containing protein